jgi:cell division protein FtsN
MAPDYAKKTRSGKTGQQARARSPRAEPVTTWKWFTAGLVCGVFLSFMAWLSSQPREGSPVLADADQVTADSPPKPRFDFYTLLPEQQVKVETGPAKTTSAKAVTTDSDQFLLQAGSFKQPADADRRRGELILLGLEARVEETQGDNGRWFRVYIGPFQSRSKMTRARSLTAQQGIDTLLMKRPRQG